MCLQRCCRLKNSLPPRCSSCPSHSPWPDSKLHRYMELIRCAPESLPCYASRSHQYTFTGSQHCHVCAQSLASLCHVSCNIILIAHPPLASSPSIWLPLRAFPESPSSSRSSHSVSLASSFRYSMPEK